MTDLVDKATRSRIMASIKGKNTKPELIVKRHIRGLGFSYQPKIKGSPDFINRKRKIVIFVHGCFWHKCPLHYRIPQSNKKFWHTKILNNIRRDKECVLTLSKKGYKVIIIWEHELRTNSIKILKKIKKYF